jgi:glycosyltransferase involved in cell wall biosynthesis
MNAERAQTTVAPTPLAQLEDAVDSVYFLMFDGWEQELESNRRHYARRWARHFPVTLLLPRERFGSMKGATAAATVDNCEVLPIAKTTFSSPYHLRGIVQTAQVMDHMSKRGHRKPLLWCYNPGLATLYAGLPAVARVFHASENYFDYPGMPELFYRELEAALGISDLVVAVSSGVTDGILSQRPGTPVATVTNGCDLAHYGLEGALSPEIAAACDGFERVAVFAGNINGRVDFGLLRRAAAANPRTVVMVIGPVYTLDEHDAEEWRNIRALPNVRHRGRMSPTELAAVYRSADLGFIPYRQDPWLVRNSFPLKTLEMAATGLPVVASNMEPIVDLAAGIAVSANDERFLDSFASLSRSTLTEDETLELLGVAAANDYEKKFEEVVSSLAAAIPAGRSPGTRLDDLLASVGYDSWLAGCAQIFRVAKPSLIWRGVLMTYAGLARAVPAETRERLVPASLRKWARGRVAR